MSGLRSNSNLIVIIVNISTGADLIACKSKTRFNVLFNADSQPYFYYLMLNFLVYQFQINPAFFIQVRTQKVSITLNTFVFVFWPNKPTTPYLHLPWRSGWEK